MKLVTNSASWLNISHWFTEDDNLQAKGVFKKVYVVNKAGHGGWEKLNI